jgi:predicted amino acid-binding ACT domain protein
VITNEVTTAIARVDVELADVSSRVENNYETLSTEISKTNLHIDASIQQLTTRLDSSLQEMVDFIYENTQVFAASWAMFREKNPDLNWTDFPY